MFCITTNLCPKHREDVLASIKEVLRAAEPDKQKDGEHTNTNDKNAAPCLCIATQCVEAVWISTFRWCSESGPRCRPSPKQLVL